MIPVAVLTGFLGSGKTSLLARLLNCPGFARTAVIINEFGEVGLDHDLIATGSDSVITLQSGCLCCRVRDGLSGTLLELMARREAGLLPAFERVVIETSGLADPAPILQVLIGDRALADRLALAGVVTTVDAVTGPHTLTHQPEAVQQVALADRLVLTKVDLLQGSPTELERRVRAINPRAKLLTVASAPSELTRLFAAGPLAPDAIGDDAFRLAHDGVPTGGPHGRTQHGVQSFAVVREQPLPAAALTLLLEALAQHCGADLLRLKGILDIAESPGRPAVVHAVQHLFHAPQWLERWPSTDRRTRLVFIVRDVSREWVVALLKAIEIEVGEIADQS